MSDKVAVTQTKQSRAAEAAMHQLQAGSNTGEVVGCCIALQWLCPTVALTLHQQLAGFDSSRSTGLHDAHQHYTVHAPAAAPSCSSAQPQCPAQPSPACPAQQGWAAAAAAAAWGAAWPMPLLSCPCGAAAAACPHQHPPEGAPVRACGCNRVHVWKVLCCQQPTSSGMSARSGCK